MINFATFGLISIHFLCFPLIKQTHTTTLWKLNIGEGKIQPHEQLRPVFSLQDHSLDDLIFNTILSTNHSEEKIWIKHADYITKINNESATIKPHKYSKYSEEILDCGKIAHSTQYDDLVSIQERNKHPNIAEPHVSLILNLKNKKNDLFHLQNEIDVLEQKLKKHKREKPKSIQLYNQIGNFWRLKGNTLNAIECFRKALAVSPHNAEVLLNLARLLLTVHSLEDSLHLARVSLSVLHNENAAWQQYFTLGEIFKALGSYKDAIICLRRSLEMKPGFEPAQIALKQVENISNYNIDPSSVLIIILLATLILWVMGTNSFVIYMKSNTTRNLKTSKNSSRYKY